MKKCIATAVEKFYQFLLFGCIHNALYLIILRPIIDSSRYVDPCEISLSEGTYFLTGRIDCSTITYAMNPLQVKGLSPWAWLAIGIDFCLILDGLRWTVPALFTGRALGTPEEFATWLVLYCAGLVAILFAISSNDLFSLMFWNAWIFVVLIFVPSPPSWPT